MFSLLISIYRRKLLSDVYQEFSYELLLNIGTYYVYITAFAMSNLQTVVANRATQDAFLSHKRIWIHNFHVLFFLLFSASQSE